MEGSLGSLCYKFLRFMNFLHDELRILHTEFEQGRVEQLETSEIIDKSGLQQPNKE